MSDDRQHHSLEYQDCETKFWREPEMNMAAAALREEDNNQHRSIITPMINPYASSSFPFRSFEEANVVDPSQYRATGATKQIHASTSTPLVISFGESNDSDHGSKLVFEGYKTTSNKEIARHTEDCSQDHVIAERKRRERMNELFLELSKSIPGLKKTDKTSLLEEAIYYVKQLETKFKTLEDQNAKASDGTAVESATSSRSFHDRDQEPLLQIDGKLSEKTVSLRIHCKTQKKVFVKLLTEIEKLRLTIKSTNLIPFSDSSLVVTVTAQVEEGFSMTIWELVENLSSSFSLLI